MSRRSVRNRLAWRSKRYFKADKPGSGDQTKYDRSAGRNSQSKISRWRLGRRFMSAGLLVLAVGLAINWSFVRNLDVAIIGANDDVRADASGQIDDILGSSTTARFKPLLDTAGLAGRIEKELSNLYQVRVEAPIFSSTLYITAQTRQPLAYIKASQNGQQTEESKTATWLIDQTGQAYGYNGEKSTESENLEIIENLHLAQIIDTSQLSQVNANSSDNVAPAGAAFPVAVVNFVYRLNTLLLQENLADKAITVEIGAETRQVTWRPAGVGYGVKLNTERDVLDQVNEYKSMWEYLQRRGVAPGSYIDLRVDDTGYYR